MRPREVPAERGAAERRLDLHGAGDLQLARVLLNGLAEALDQRVGLRRSSGPDHRPARLAWQARAAGFRLVPRGVRLQR